MPATSESPVTARLRRIDPFVWIIGAASLITVVVARMAGVSFTADQLSAHPHIVTWQLLDLPLLQHDLLRSIYQLEMQPPLYNLGIGILLHLPRTLQKSAAELVQFLFYVVTGLATFGALRELGSPRRIALGVTIVLVVLDPAQFLYSATTFYATPTAALVTCLAYSIIRLIKHPTYYRALAFGAIGATLALLNTSVQPLFVFVLSLLVVLAARAAWRTIVRGFLIPLSILLLWTVHTLVSFGTPATSTWLGMNAAHATISAAPPHEIQRLIRTHRLSPLAAIGPFSSLASYGPVPSSHGNSALTQVTKEDGSPNFNNRAYVAISNRYLHEDLRYVRAEPYQYLTHVVDGVTIWFVPADQYFTLSPGMAWYRDAYDTYIQWQPQNDPNAGYLAAFFHQYPSSSQISYLQLAEVLLILIGVPVLVVAWWKRQPALARAMALVGVVFLQSFVIMNLTDIGENNRFRFEAGTLPIILATTVVLAALGRLQTDEPSRHIDPVRSPEAARDTMVTAPSTTELSHPSGV